MREKGDWVGLVLLKARVRRIGGQMEAMAAGVVLGVLVVLVLEFGLGWIGV